MSEEPTISKPVTLSEKDFLDIYKALWRSHLPFTVEEVADIVHMEKYRLEYPSTGCC